jgi:hypothetical protein
MQAIPTFDRPNRQCKKFCCDTGFCQETKSGHSFLFTLPFIYILASPFAFSLLLSSRSLELLLKFQTLLIGRLLKHSCIRSTPRWYKGMESGPRDNIPPTMMSTPPKAKVRNINSQTPSKKTTVVSGRGQIDPACFAMTLAHLRAR